MTASACILLGASLAGCGGGAEEEGNQAAATNAQATEQAQAMNDPANPYAPSEMRMHERMTATKGANPSETWARKMIEHHRGAIEMSQLLLQHDPQSRYAPIARTMIAEQEAEIRRLERILQAPAASPATAPRAEPRAAARPKAEPRGAQREPAKAPPKAPPPPPEQPAEPPAEMNGM